MKEPSQRSASPNWKLWVSEMMRKRVGTVFDWADEVDMLGLRRGINTCFRALLIRNEMVLVDGGDLLVKYKNAQSYRSLC